MKKSQLAKVSIITIVLIISGSLIGTVIYATAMRDSEKVQIQVGILDPDNGDTISGDVKIDAIILHPHPSWGYAISVLVNENLLLISLAPYLVIMILLWHDCLDTMAL